MKQVIRYTKEGGWMLTAFLALGFASFAHAASLTVNLAEGGGKFVVTLNDLTATNSLWAAWDESDKGEQPGDWANAERIQTVTPETGSVEYPLPAGWGENIKAIRFFLSEVPYDYDYTLDFLRSGTTATDGTTTRRILLNDFGFNVKYRVEVRMREAKHNTSGNLAIFSARGGLSGGTVPYFDLFKLENGSWRFDYNTVNNDSVPGAETNVIYDIVADGENGLWVNGSKITTKALTYLDESVSGKLEFFNGYTTKQSNNNGNMDLFNARVYASSAADAELLVNLVPMVKDGRAGLYDTIRDKYYYNDLTGGDFKLNNGCSRVESENPFYASTVFDLDALGLFIADIPAQNATGYEVCPAPVVTDRNGTVLEKDVDYVVDYTNNLYVGTGKALVKPIGEFAKTVPFPEMAREKTFEIVSVYRLGADAYARGDLGHFDAIENAGLGLPHDASVTNWVDLNGGEGWTLTSHGSWKNGNAFHCDGRGVAGTCSTSQYSVVAAEIAFNMAAEASAASGSGGSTIWMSGQRTGEGYSAYFAAFEKNQMTLVRGKRVDITVGQNTTLVANYNLDAETGLYAASVRNAYLDGEVATVANAASAAYNSGGGASCTIGARTSSTEPRAFNGDIYAIRLYSRELTADEARRHAVIDSIRYFGEAVLAVGDIPTQTYDGKHPCEPKLFVTNRVTCAELVEDTHYRVIYSDNDVSGTATARIVGLGDFAGYVQDETFVVFSSEFTTPGELDDVCTVEYSPTSADLPVFSGSVKTFGDGEVHTVRLLMGTNPDEMSEAASVEVTAEGPFSVAATWCDYGLPVYYRFVYETSDGEKSYYSDTSNSSEPSPDYTATYTWKGGAEADWAGSDSWTVSGATVSNPKPYPFSETLHAVIFPSKANATVRLKGGEACLYIKPGAGATFRLQGVGDEPVPFTTGIIRWYSAQNVTCVCDRVAVRLTNVSGSTDNSCESFGTGSLLRFENGGSISVSGVGSYGVNFSPNTGYTVEVDGGAYDYRPSPAANYSISFSGQSRMLVRDGLMRSTTTFSLCNAATGPSAWTFEGAAPRLVALSNFGVTGAAGTTLTFKPGSDGFAEPVISVSNQVAFAAGSYDKGPVTVSVPKDAGIWKASARQDVVLLSAPNGINTNVIEFAQMPRSSGTFVYLPEGAENPTSLVFRYKPRGFALILK